MLAAVESPGGAVSFPPRRERAALLSALMGTADPAVRPLALGIRATAHRHFDRHVTPLVAAHWPALVGQPFHAKLRIGACDLYASAPYTALFCARRRPLLVRAVTSAGNRLPLPRSALALLGRGAMEVIGRFSLAEEHRRIILVAAFIVVVDHAFDHAMTEAPGERGRRLAAVIDGREAPGTPELRLTRALAEAMGEGLGPRDRPAFEAAMRQMKRWIQAEVQAMRGEPDPRKLGHRLAGVEGTIDGLLFPVARYAGEGARGWMVDVSFFVQVADDWLDVEDDLRSGRPTPVITGAWTFADVEAAWRRTIEGVEAMVRSAGLGSPRYVRFIREVYVLMMLDVMDAMVRRPGQ